MQPDEAELPQTPGISPEKRLDNALRAATLSVSRFPQEQWIQIDTAIFLAHSRLSISSNQRDILKKEIAQARILTERGSSVYLIPEKGEGKHPDAVVDGHIMEFKTITGNIGRIEEHYLAARAKARRVFFKIDSDLSRKDVLSRLIACIRKGNYTKGHIIAYFSHTGKIYLWEEDRLK
jgi:hypothetical protein